MKRRGLLILSAAVLVIGGYALYEYRVDHMDPEKKEASMLIAKSTEEQISGFMIENEKQIIEVIKADNIWKMTKPIQDQANQVAAKDFITGVLTEGFIETAKEGSEIDWSAFGLDKPRATISLTSSDGSKEIFKVGSAKNFEGNSFIRHNDSNKVLVASSTWFAKADKKIGDFRDQRLMRWPNSTVTMLTFEHGKEKFTLTRKENIWMNMDQLRIRLDQNKVREILGMLNNTEALEFVSEKAGSAQDMKDWGFSKPSLKLSAQQEDGKIWTALFSSGQDRIYRVAVSDPQFVLKLSPVDGEKFLMADFDSFRDRREAFRFDRTKAKLVQIKTEKLSKDLKNEGDDSVAEIVKKIESLGVTLFLPASKQELKNEVTILDAENKQLIKFNWGSPQKIKIVGSDTSVVQARSSLVDYDFYITEQEINALKLQDSK